MTSQERTAALKRDGRWLFFAALGVRLLVVGWAWSRVPPSADGAFYDVVAGRIASGEGYTWLWPDGVVTHAAHYPVGYPALVGGLYWLFGPQPGFAMLANALIGAGGVWAVHGLSFEACRVARVPPRIVRLAALAAAGLVALLPTLLLYTPALMTELAVGSVLAVAARLALSANGRQGRAFWGRVVLVGVLGGAAVLLRPQSILVLPVLGWLAASGRGGRAIGAGIVTLALGLVVVAPWTWRNCQKMERCVFVSANGGWNLLIGTYPEGNGAWVPIEGKRVPRECREVFQEAHKDACFRDAGIERVGAAPGRWLSLVPAKLAATFDYTAAAAAHLQEAGTLSAEEGSSLARFETVTQRVFWALAALGGLWGASGWRRRMRSVAVLLALVLLALPFAWGAIVLVGLLAGTMVRPGRSVAIGFGVASIAATVAVHAVFFGAGRYSMPLLYAAAPLAALGTALLFAHTPLGRQAQSFDSGRATGR